LYRIRADRAGIQRPRKAVGCCVALNAKRFAVFMLAHSVTPFEGGHPIRNAVVKKRPLPSPLRQRPPSTDQLGFSCSFPNAESSDLNCRSKIEVLEHSNRHIQYGAGLIYAGQHHGCGGVNVTLESTSAALARSLADQMRTSRAAASVLSSATAEARSGVKTSSSGTKRSSLSRCLRI
jgi:hypothetical protein